MTKRINQLGFSVIEALLVIVALGIIGFTGWYVLNAKHNADASYNNTLKSALDISPTKKSKVSSKTTSQIHTLQEATTFVQTTYDSYLTAIKKAGTNNTQPLGQVGLRAVKDNLTNAFYTQAAASHNGGAFSCESQSTPSKYVVGLAPTTSANATIPVSIWNSDDGSYTTGGMTVNVDLASLKITAVNCPR